MPLELTATSKTFRLHDESGYEFVANADYDPEFGWNASISCAVRGIKTAEEAVAGLTLPLERALLMVRSGHPMETADEISRLRNALSGVLMLLTAPTIGDLERKAIEKCCYAGMERKPLNAQ